MRQPQIKRGLGFTLVELMVTLAVLAVVAAAAVPSFTDFFDKYRLRGAADDVISLVANARADSVKTDRDVSISLSGTTTAWCVGANAATEPTGGLEAGTASTCDCTNTAATTCVIGGSRLAINAGAHGNVTVGSVATSFIYDSKLGVIDPLGAQTITLNSPSAKYAVNVQVSALGQARACVPNGKPAMAGVPSC